MNFSELAKTRYSVRKFTDELIRKEDMDVILEAANVAPTGCNKQPQRIYVVQSEENIAKLNSVCRCIFGAKTVLLFTCDKDDEWKNPLEAGVSSGVQDISIVASHVMLQAWELGIGTCWVNYFPPTKLEEVMEIPENEKVLLLMPMGYPAADSEPGPMHAQYKAISDTVKFI